ncbi:hypothetical protein L1276_001732 [Flavobacterium sp. HSC-32F16]|nr:hypothetical protein [Flavobacterium sp. HSC-32F16]
MKIVWSSRATYTFYTTRNYLKQFRNNEIAQKFVTEVLHIINLIEFYDNRQKPLKTLNF